MPASASAHGVKKLHPAGVHRAVISASPRATAEAGKTAGRTLIFGGGDEAGAGLGINPTESLTNLEDMLTNAGYSVDVSAQLPKSLTKYKAIWFINTQALTLSEEVELESFVEAGHGLYLTGVPDGCCTGMDSSDSSVLNALVSGGGIQAGGQGEADNPSASNSVMPDAIDAAAQNPTGLTGWTPAGPGGMAGVAAPNVLTSTTFEGVSKPTGAVWDGSSLKDRRGRLAILMNVNWLESEFWDQVTATQMVVNLERFLTSANPVPAAFNAQWAGYAASAGGVSDVSGKWTVPTVECSEVAAASAVGTWVGIDGFGNNNLVKAGAGVTCSSPNARPCYYLFTKVLPGAESPITGCSGVAPGDDLSVDVANSPYGSSTFVITIVDNGNPVGQPTVLTARTFRDTSAECVVELPSGKVGPTPAKYKQLADFGSVSFTQCEATATQDAGNALDVDQLPTGSDDIFTVTTLNMGNRIASKATVNPPDFPDLTWSVSWKS